MRADRLLSLMLLLHARGRLTAADLAEHLEVSERTIYRDVEALSMAGVPIYTQTGTSGGIFLDEDYRISLTGLSREQVFSIFAAPEAGPLADLGLARAAEDSLLKLFAALPQSRRRDVESLRARIYIDPHGWFHNDHIPRILPPLQQAVWEDFRVTFDYEAVGAELQTRTVDAYALVSKSDVWYLVGRKSNGDMRSYRLSRIQSVTVLDDQFERDPAFDLAAYWQQARTQFKQQMEQQFERYEVRLRVHPQMYWYFGSFMEGRYQRTGPADADGWIPVLLLAGGVDEACTHVMGLGRFAWVDSPAELRDLVRERAQAVVEHIQHFRPG